MKLNDVDQDLNEVDLRNVAAKVSAANPFSSTAKAAKQGRKDTKTQAAALINAWSKHAGRMGLTLPVASGGDAKVYRQKYLKPYMDQMSRFITKQGYDANTFKTLQRKIDTKQLLTGQENPARMVKRLLLALVQAQPDIAHAGENGIPSDLIDAIKKLSPDQQQLLGKTLLGQ